MELSTVETHKEAWVMKAKELYNLKQIIKDLEKKEKTLSFELQDLSQNQTTSYGNLRYSCDLVKGNVDYTIIPELKLVNLELYRKEPSQRWKLEVLEIL